MPKLCKCWFLPSLAPICEKVAASLGLIFSESVLEIPNEFLIFYFLILESFSRFETLHFLGVTFLVEKGKEEGMTGDGGFIIAGQNGE